MFNEIRLSYFVNCILLILLRYTRFNNLYLIVIISFYIDSYYFREDTLFPTRIFVNEYR